MNSMRLGQLAFIVARSCCQNLNMPNMFASRFYVDATSEYFKYSIRLKCQGPTLWVSRQFGSLVFDTKLCHNAKGTCESVES